MKAFLRSLFILLVLSQAQQSAAQTSVYIVGGGSAVTVADGANVTEGATTDAAVTGDTNGTINAHLRGLDKIIFDTWDSTNHFLKITGGKTNNAVVPGAFNLGTLNGIANAAAPTWTETFQVGASYDLHGSARTLLLDSTGAAITPSCDQTQNTAISGCLTGPGIMGWASAIATAPTAAGANARGQFNWVTLEGAQVNAPSPGGLASGAITSAMAATTSTSLIGATASNYIYITQCTTSNASTTVSTDILLQDGSGGTTLYVLPAPAASVATTGGGGGAFTFPIPLKVPTAGNALFAQNVTTGSSTKISCSGYKTTVSY